MGLYGNLALYFCVLFSATAVLFDWIKFDAETKSCWCRAAGCRATVEPAYHGRSTTFETDLSFITFVTFALATRGHFLGSWSKKERGGWYLRLKHQLIPCTLSYGRSNVPFQSHSIIPSYPLTYLEQTQLKYCKNVTAQLKQKRIAMISP